MTGYTQEDGDRETNCCRERGEKGPGVREDPKKAWSSINHSILSGVAHRKIITQRGI
jgi:hypothetical protein